MILHRLVSEEGKVTTITLESSHFSTESNDNDISIDIDEKRAICFPDRDDSTCHGGRSPFHTRHKKKAENP